MLEEQGALLTVRFCDEWEKWINTVGKRIALGTGSTKSLFSVL